MQIIDVRSLNDIDVQFLDEHGYIKQHVLYTNFKNGQIKNPYDITVSTVGYIGYGIHKSSYKKNTVYPGYKTWANMLRRCYDVRYQEMFPSYMGVSTVCEEWHNYQNFADWYDENKYEVDERLHVDKDILYPSCHLYSPDTCLLVPQRINMLFTVSTRKNDGLPQGIKKNKSGTYVVSYGENQLGTHKTLDEAFLHYKKAKEQKIKEVAFQYKTIIPNRLFEELLKYEVKIENNINVA